MEIYTKILLASFGLAVILGFFVNKTNFCTMGAVSDVVNIGDTGRMRAWFFAIGLAILGVMGLQLAGLIDIGLTSNNATANPPYRTSQFAWPRYLLGGLIFGVGMTLGSGCGNKTLLRLGGGNLKSIFVIAAMAITAYAMIFTNASYDFFLKWMEPAVIDLSARNITDQSITSILAGLFGIESSTLHIAVPAIIGGLFILWAIKSKDFRGSFDNMLAAVVIAGVILVGWYVTAGALGQSMLEEAEFMDNRPYALGAQSFTFIQPNGHFLEWVRTGFASTFLTFALLAAAGVIVGSFIYSVMFKKFRIEWFSSWKDFFTHIIGGLLMGTGGVLAMGCTIGQGITGTSTLALGSFVVLGSIILGSALTMKIQYYKMVYEDEASFGKALIAGLADLKLVPGALRKLDPI